MGEKMDDLVLRCHKCGTRNRIPVKRMGDNPKCGKCQTLLRVDGFSDGRVVKVTDSDFEDKVIRSPLPVLLDCWASWCGPCKMMAPLMDELAEEYKGRIRVAKLNVDDNPLVSSRFRISSIPTFLLFYSGKIEGSLVGAVSKNDLKKLIQRFL